MFGALTICYLFFGGAGAGTLLVASVVDLAWAKEPFGASATGSSADSARPLRRIVAHAFLAGFLAVAFGVLCLLFDLGRIDRVEMLFLSPTATYLTLGSFALAALLACSAFLVVARFFYLPDVGRRAVVAFEVAAVVLSLVVAAYTGMLLSSLQAVAFWDTPLVPVLFTLSSLSSGCAALLVMALAAEADDEATARVVGRLARVDLALIAIEAVCAAAFALLALGSAQPSEAQAASRLFAGAGNLALVWWVGFVGCGLVAPFALECAAEAASWRRRRVPRQALALAGALVLVGAFCLRLGIVDAGAHRELALEDPLEAAAALDVGEALQDVGRDAPSVPGAPFGAVLAAADAQGWGES